MGELATRRLGRTEIRAKALGLGCATFGGPPRTDRDGIETVRRAIELGIDFVDTSPAYGESERRTGLGLAGGWREKVFLQTKTGTHPDRRGDYTAEATRWSVENSLKLFKTDYLDSVLIHDFTDIEDPFGPDRALDELLKMKERGIVHHVGVGVRNHDLHKRAIETGKIDVVLTFLDYTLLDQSVAKTTLPLARQHDVGVLLASPNGMGLLAGPDPDHEPAHAMWQWCRDRGLNVRQLAMQFCLAAPIDGVVIAGPGNQQELEEVYEAATTEVPPEIWRQFKDEFGIAEYQVKNATARDD